MSTDAQAMTLHEGPRFEREPVRLDAPRAGEVRVRIAGVGICHTDVHVAHGHFPYPRPCVLGHEGAGIVDAVGEAVTQVTVGDHVVLTFNSCGACSQCEHGHPAYCESFAALNFQGARPDGSTTLQGPGGRIHGSFFSQSSFATHVIATERNVVKVPRDLPLERLGPLGCGVQTGAGTVLNVLRPAPGQSIAVFGTGAVGLSAVMAARLAGCSTIVAVDLRKERLQLARELGATHTLDGGNESAQDAIAALGGVDFAIDTTGQPAVIETAVASLRLNGSCALLGATAPGARLGIDLLHLTLGRTVRGVIEGDATPSRFIPQLIDHHRAGRFPFDRLIRYYDFADINEAIADMDAGRAVKPVLRMSSSR